MRTILLQYLKERYQRVSTKDLMQYHADMLAGKTTLDLVTQNNIKGQFGVSEGGRD